MSVSRKSFLATAALVVLGVAACTGPPAPRFLIGSGEASRDIRIDVVNDNYADMTVYVVRESSNLRLGDVVGKNSRSFTLDPDQISPSRGLQLLADPIGSRSTFTSEAITADPGSWVVFNISPNLSQSYITLR
jgi:hypothetical protein